MVVLVVVVVLIPRTRESSEKLPVFMRKKDIFEFEVHDNDGNYATKLITQFNGREIDTASCLAFAPKRRTGPVFFAEIVVTMCFFFIRLCITLQSAHELCFFQEQMVVLRRKIGK